MYLIEFDRMSVIKKIHTLQNDILLYPSKISYAHLSYALHNSVDDIVDISDLDCELHRSNE